MTSNKFRWLAALAVAGMLSWLPMAGAADNPGTDKPGAGRAERVRERLRDVAKDLNLTADQKTKLKPLLQEQMQKLRELVQDKSTSRQDKLAKFKAIQDEYTPKIKEILTAAQFEKWQKTRDDAIDKLRERISKRRK